MTRYVTDRLDLRLGDCMDLMRDTPDGFYDLSIVDPPYGINFAKTHTGKGWTVRESKDWDSERPSMDYFKEVFRCSKNQVVWGANYFSDFLPPSQGWIFWDKGQREFSLADGELAFTSFDRALRVFCFTRAHANQETKIHPTQKPVALYRWLLTNYAKPGMRVLDTHLGSGSHAIAAHYAGVHLTATEIDPDYFAAAVERIQRETQQLDFFTPQPVASNEPEPELF